MRQVNNNQTDIIPPSWQLSIPTLGRFTHYFCRRHLRKCPGLEEMRDSTQILLASVPSKWRTSGEAVPARVTTSSFSIMSQMPSDARTRSRSFLSNVLVVISGTDMMNG